MVPLSFMSGRFTKRFGSMAGRFMKGFDAKRFNGFKTTRTTEMNLNGAGEGILYYFSGWHKPRCC